VEAPHAEAALVLAGAMHEPIHLLVSDLVMPGIGGLLLAERMVSSRPAMQVLFITGYAPEAVDRHGELAAAGALLEKPFTADQLARKVREVLAAAV
jgi:two-component system, cell cycle sensor histidine kinase and response regulator CckA